MAATDAPAGSPLDERLLAREPDITAQAPEQPAPDPERFFNRELSWVQFNERVLELAEDERQPLMERLKFAAIWCSNLDEFFMIRVAGLHDQVDAGVRKPLYDGRSAAETIAALREAVCEGYGRLVRCVEGDLLPELEGRAGVRVVGWEDLDDAARAELRERYERQVFPVLTPLAVGVGRPFPYISNLSLSLAVHVRDPTTGQGAFARVKVPTEVLPRFLEAGENVFVPLEAVIAANLESLFPGMEIVDHGAFRVTRDADFEISDEADDLLRAVEQELRRRRFGEAVRVELSSTMAAGLREQLVQALEVEADQVYELQGRLLDFEDLWELVKLPGFPELRDEPWTPVTQPRLRGRDDDEPADLFAAIRQGDLLVHHPYDSFATSVERFVEQASRDPDVLAIKQTVYRTSDDTPLIPALIRATERGKQAVCLVELKARFDERANIGWARKLEESGAHVVHGLPNLKTHAKCVLVVRREGDGVRHYVHVGTGNYHPKTARLYTDFGLFTADPEMGADVADLFNFLTGFARPRRLRKVLAAPYGLRDGILAEIDRTTAAAERGERARIRMKMNSLVDRRCIVALYEASQAGVEVELNIRGICCLRPGVEGMSDGIVVRSVVGRFLEHSRIFAFERGDEQRVLIGSADLMPRNLDTRVELVAPVEDPALRADLLDALERCMADDTQSWELDADGSWTRRTPGPEPRDAQAELMAIHARLAREDPA